MIADLKEVLHGEIALEDNLQDELFSYVRSLDQTIQERIITLDILGLLEQDINFQPLQNVQKIIVQNEVLLALLGLVEIRDFVTSIKVEAEISRDRAEKIFKTIEREILTPNSDILESVFDIVGGGESKESTYSTNDIKRPTENSSNSGTIRAIERTPAPAEKPINFAKPAAIRTMFTDRESSMQTQTSTVPSQTPPQMIPRRPAPENEVPARPIVSSPEEVFNKPKDESLDIFKKQLEQPVHTPTTEQRLGESGRAIGNTNPTPKATLASDPYKETIE